MNRYTIIIITIAFFCINSCGVKNAPLVSTLHTEGLHHKWKIAEMAGDEPAANIYIDLRDVYRSGATAGCQYFSFTPKFGHHNRIKIDNISGHLATCADVSVDNKLLNDLEQVATFSIADDKLKLSDANGAVLFTAHKATDDKNGSLNRKWLIQTMINAEDEQLQKDTAFIDLSDLTKGTGTVGCNRFSFIVNADDTYNISIAKAISTRMFCQDAAVNEAVFAKVLPLISKYQVIGNRLKLFDKDNVLLIEAGDPLGLSR